MYLTGHQRITTRGGEQGLKIKQVVNDNTLSMYDYLSVFCGRLLKLTPVESKGSVLFPFITWCVQILNADNGFHWI